MDVTMDAGGGGGRFWSGGDRRRQQRRQRRRGGRGVKPKEVSGLGFCLAVALAVTIAAADRSARGARQPPRATPSRAAREWRRAIERANALNSRDLVVARKGIDTIEGARKTHEPAPRVLCEWRESTSGARFDLSGLTLPRGSAYLFHDAQGDAAHDSVHAEYPGRGSEDDPQDHGSTRLRNKHKRVFTDDDDDVDGGDETRDEYDYWVNVCRAVSTPPRACEGKPGAPAYQVVVPGGTLAKTKTKTKTAAKDEPEGTPPSPPECHALGDLNNVTFRLLDPDSPAAGVALTYGGGDTCMKRVVVPPTEGVDVRGGAPTLDAAEEDVRWVPTARRMTLRITCDPADEGVHDPASLMQMMRRVSVAEDEMCEYVLEWPSVHGGAECE